MRSGASIGSMAGAKSFQEQLDVLTSAYRVLTDGKLDRRDAQAVVTGLGALAGIASLAYLVLAAAGVLPPIVVEATPAADVEAVEHEGEGAQ